MRLMRLGEIHRKDRSWEWKELSDHSKHLIRVKFKHTLRDEVCASSPFFDYFSKVKF